MIIWSNTCKGKAALSQGRDSLNIETEGGGGVTVQDL